MTDEHQPSTPGDPQDARSEPPPALSRPAASGAGSRAFRRSPDRITA